MRHDELLNMTDILCFTETWNYPEHIDIHVCVADKENMNGAGGGVSAYVKCDENLAEQQQQQHKYDDYDWGYSPLCQWHTTPLLLEDGCEDGCGWW